jgi:hypothetical protein
VKTGPRYKIGPILHAAGREQVGGPLRR